MAECKSCKKNIAEGSELCDDCLDKNVSKSNESYLDDLLNSVKNPSQESKERELEEEIEEEVDSEEEEDIDENFIIDEIEGIMEEEHGDESLDDLDDEVDDLAELLAQMNSDDPVAANIKEVSDLLSGKGVDSPEESDDLEEADDPVDVGDVFSDALKVVNSLEDSDVDEGLDIQEGQDLSVVTLEEKEKDKGQGFFARVFGNVPDETAASKEADKESVKEEEKSKEKKEQREKRKAEKKEIREKSKKEKEELKKEKKKERKEKKELKRRKAAIEYLDEDEGEINRLGASIVFAFFAIVVIVILLGTNLFSYSLNIRKATDHFEQNNYTDAYNEVYGVDLNDSHIELYDKVMTVMFVNKQLNSYNRYYAMGKYPEALDSLLKGLERYDKYIEFATIINIESDLDYVKTQIIDELDSVFHLSESQAYRIIDSETQMEYSIRVYDVILENGDFESL